MADFRSRETPSAGQATTNAYVDVPLLIKSDGSNATEVIFSNTSTFAPLSFHVWNDGANAIDFKVLASNDRSLADSLWVDQALTGFTNVAANAAVAVSIAQPGFAFYKVQTQDHVGGSHGTAHVALAKQGTE